MNRLPLATAAAALGATLLLAGCATAPDGPRLPAGSKRFTGTVQAVDDGCFADGTCSVTVDGILVVTLTGWSRDTWGTRDQDLRPGERVQVACRPTLEGCTLNGDAGYYVRRAK